MSNLIRPAVLENDVLTFAQKKRTKEKRPAICFPLPYQASKSSILMIYLSFFAAKERTNPISHLCFIIE